MRELRKWVWTAIVAAAATTPVAAQQGTVTTGGGRTTSSLTGTGGLTGGGAGQLGSSTTGGGGGSSTGGTGGSEFTGSALMTMQAPPKLQAPTGQNTSSLSALNRFAGYYANPYFQGNSLQVNSQPGGFGMPPAGTGTTGRGAIAGTTGAGAGRTGIGGGVGGLNNANQSGILIPLPVQIAYTARMQFPTPPVPAGKITSEVRAIIDNTSAIANPKAVQIITDANNNVTIRGTVKDDDEARLIEGLVRITPGVGAITNELAPQVATR
jgi:hypothetical protein